MTAYGSKLYGSFTYGSVSSDLNIYPFTVSSTDYGVISLKWTVLGSLGAVSKFYLVRNALGFPLTPDDGDILINTVAGGTAGFYVDRGAYIDPLTTSVTPSYVITSANDATINSTTVTLNNVYGVVVGSLVYGPSGVQGGTTVTAIKNTTVTLNKPVTIGANANLTFSPVALAAGKSYYYSAFAYASGNWTRLGNAIGVSVNDYGTAALMYKYLPEVYSLPVNASDSQNVDLFNFLRIFAFEYDLFKTNANNAKNRYDVRELDARLIPALLQEFGFNYESAMGIQQARKLLQYASLIYLTKGSVAGIKRFIAAFSGYSADLGTLKNLFLTTNCASFESNDGYWGLISSANNTMAVIANEGAASPYSESGSPSGYPNAQKGFLKYTAVTAGSPVFGYGVSPDTISIPVANNPVSATGALVTLNTGTTPHGLSVGQTIIIAGLTAAGYNTSNTTTTVTAVPSPTSFTYANTTTGAISTAGTVAVFNPVLWGIPVTAGTVYTYSIYSRAATTLRSISLTTNWYDKDGKYLSLSGPANTNNSTSAWTRITQTNITAPTNAVYAVPQVTINSAGAGEVHYFDAAQFNVGSTALTFADARRIDLYLKANRINSVINPSFETNSSAWTTTGTTSFSRVSGGAITGSSWSGQLLANASTSTLTPSSTIAVIAGNPYALSAYVKGSNADTVTLSVVWKNAGGTTLQTDTGSAVTLTTSFVRASLIPVSGSTTQMIAPATATTATITFTFAGANGHTYTVDAILFESTSVVNAYFDGVTGYNFTDDLLWENNGTDSTSRSLYYKNKTTAVSRLGTVVPDYLPAWSNWVLFTGIPSA